MSEVAGIAIRWALYADLGLLFGLPLFALYAPGGGRTVQRHLPMGAMVACLACFGLLLSALGFAVQAAAMSGLPLTQPDFALLGDLINETAMGAALKARLVALLVLLFCVLLYRRQSRPAFIASTLAGALALATLAWSGHGAAGEGYPGWLQLVADLVHLLAAGAWVGALAAFLALVMPKAATGDMERVSLAEEALTGFSLVGTIIVALLILTGMGASHKTGTDIRSHDCHPRR
ncbi:copper resistance protein CopD, partial [Sphingobium yanoikuyae]